MMRKAFYPIVHREGASADLCDHDLGCDLYDCV